MASNLKKALKQADKYEGRPSTNSCLEPRRSGLSDMDLSTEFQEMKVRDSDQAQ